MLRGVTELGVYTWGCEGVKITLLYVHIPQVYPP